MIELKRTPPSAKRSSLDLTCPVFDSKVHLAKSDYRFRRRSHGPREISSRTPRRSPLGSLCSPTFDNQLGRRVSPDVLRRVLADNLDQQIEWVHFGRSQRPRESPLFQNTRKYEWFLRAWTCRTTRLTPGRFVLTTTKRSSGTNPISTYDCMISTAIDADD